MRYDFKFNLAQIVKIPELNCTGRIINIWVVERGVSYEVRYFHNGEAKQVYFFECELSEVKE